LIEKKKRRKKRKLEYDLRIQLLQERYKKRQKLSPTVFDRAAFNNGVGSVATQRVFKKLLFDRKAWTPPNE
jgi:hypothetical protein